MKTLGIAAVALLTLAACGSATPESFQGTELDPPTAAAPFHLVNQFGDEVALDDFSGKVVVLTFLYTYCPDICPLTTEMLREAYDALGDNAEETTFVAISVDPARDTVARIHEYSQQKDMLDKWHFLTGSVADLEKIWRSYYVSSEPYRTSPGGVTEALSQAAIIRAAQEGNTSAYLVGHQAPVYLIDQQGKLRVLHSDLTLDAGPLVHDVRLLLE